MVDSSGLGVQTDTDVIMQPGTSSSGESDAVISVDMPMDPTTSLSGQGFEHVTPHNGDKHLYSQTSNHARTTVTRQYQLCQYGHPEPGRNIVVRSAILVKIHGDAFGFLSLLGYRYYSPVSHSQEATTVCACESHPDPPSLSCFDSFEDEYVRRGYSFLYGNLCRITVFKKYKVKRILPCDLTSYH